jgi:F-type H+-transporting ATPase subunit epsilon
MADYQVEIYTQEKKVYDGPMTAITAPGEEGYFGVLAHHAPLLATLGSGKLTLRHGERITEHHISGGFLEVHDNKAIILADSLS